MNEMRPVRSDGKRTRQGWHFGLVLVALALAYFGAARFGLSLAVGVKQVTAVWPPTGIALAALLLFGYRAWPAVALGAFAINAVTDEPLGTAAGIAVGNTLEALCGAFLLRKVVRFDAALERMRDVLGLIVFSAVLSTAVSATIGVTSLCLGGILGAVTAERRQAERAVRESEARKAAILDVALDAVVTMDAKGDVVDFNPAAEEIFGYTRAQAIGRRLSDLLVPPRLREKHRHGLSRYLATGEGPLLGKRVEIEAMRADGTEFPVELAIRAVPNDGLPTFIGFVRDITARRRAETERSELLSRELAARVAAEAAGHRLAFLANASQALTSSLDYQTTLASLAEVAVPEIADWCFVDMTEGDSVRRLAVSHVVSSRGGLEELVKTRHLLDPKAPTGPPYVLRTGRSQLIAEVSEALLSSIARDADSFKTLQQIGIHSCICVPLRVRGDVLGVLTFVSAESGRRYSPEDLALAEDVGRRASLAIDNARLYTEAQEAVAARDEFLAVASHELKTPITTLQLQLERLGSSNGSSARCPAVITAAWGWACGWFAGSSKPTAERFA